MERYGYIYVSSEAKPIFCSPNLYSDLIDALKDGVAQDLDYLECCSLHLRYFKILSNKSILDSLHNQWLPNCSLVNEEYGFIILREEESHFVPQIYGSLFYNNLFDCLKDAVECNIQDGNNSSKIGYFKMLKSEKEVIEEIHRHLRKKN